LRQAHRFRKAYSVFQSVWRSLHGGFSFHTTSQHGTQWGYEEAFVPPFISAMMIALFYMGGFYIPQDLHRISMHGKSWKVFFSDTLGNLLTLIVSVLILVYWK